MGVGYFIFSSILLDDFLDQVLLPANIWKNFFKVVLKLWEQTPLIKLSFFVFALSGKIHQADSCIECAKFSKQKWKNRAAYLKTAPLEWHFLPPSPLSSWYSSYDFFDGIGPHLPTRRAPFNLYRDTGDDTIYNIITNPFHHWPPDFQTSWLGI